MVSLELLHEVLINMGISPYIKQKVDLSNILLEQFYTNYIIHCKHVSIKSVLTKKYIYTHKEIDLVTQ